MASKSPKNQAYCPMCKVHKPNHAYGFCPLLKCFWRHCGESGHSKDNCPNTVCWNCGGNGHFREGCPNPKVKLIEVSTPNGTKSLKPKPPRRAPPATATQVKLGSENPSVPSASPLVPTATIPSLMNLKTYASACKPTQQVKRPASLADTSSDSQAPSKKTAQDLVSSFDSFKADLGMREGQLAELDAEEAQLEKDYLAKKRELEVRRAAILEAQGRDNELRSAMAKAEEFMNYLKNSLLPKPVASSPVPAESIENLVTSSPKPSCPSSPAQVVAPSSVPVNPSTPELVIPEAPPLPVIFEGRIAQKESSEPMDCSSTSPSTCPTQSASTPPRSLLNTLKEKLDIKAKLSDLMSKSIAKKKLAKGEDSEEELLQKADLLCKK